MDNLRITINKRTFEDNFNRAVEFVKIAGFCTNDLLAMCKLDIQGRASVLKAMINEAPDIDHQSFNEWFKWVCDLESTTLDKLERAFEENRKTKMGAA